MARGRTRREARARRLGEREKALKEEKEEWKNLVKRGEGVGEG